MISTRFCPVCGAANDDTQTHCFACGQLLPASAPDVPAGQETLLRERYRLGTVIGSGGYSAVYRGWDTQDGGRSVAIKQITLRGLGTEETIEATNTYNREVEALSTLTHPQVPRLYDHFSDPDHWYLVLEYIEGQTLESYLETRASQHRPFQMEEVIGIGLQLCTVLTYLHSQHPPMIFRDVKPDNIMRTPGGKLYLIDFGIARHYISGQSRDTQSLGSPGYAAPEQYGKAQTDTRTDLYGLGALLHRLLSGRDPSETPRSLPPLHLPVQPGSIEMENLVNHLLASSPQDRPASTHEVVRVLEHVRQLRTSVLNSTRIWNPPVPQNYTASHVQQQFQSMQQQTAQRQRKRVSRRRVVGGIIGAGAATVLLAGGIGFYAYSTASANNASSQSGPGSAPALYTYTGHTDIVNSLAWSPDSQRIASASADKTVQVWVVKDGSHSYSYSWHQDKVNAVIWSPWPTQYDIVSADVGGVVRFWSADEGKAGLYSAYTSSVTALAWSPILNDSHIVEGLQDGMIYIQDSITRKSTGIPLKLGAITCLAYSPYGTYMAIGGYNRFMAIWDMQTYQRSYATYKGHSDIVTSVSWLPNGDQLVSGSMDRTAQIWDAIDGTTLLHYEKHNATVTAVSPSPDGQYIASSSEDGTVHIWSVFDGSTVMIYRGHSAPVTCVAWSPDGRLLASGSADKTVQIWNAPATL